MPFIPHTEQDVKEMLATIGVDSIEALFDEIPKSLRNVSLDGIPAGMPEMELTRFMRERARQDEYALSFIGAGAYEHHIPAAVWEITTRGEYYTAYTPYQAEASQGSLQLIYEFQTMMAGLMGMEVSNASLYDGATALAEAVLMAVRLKVKKGTASVLMPLTVHPFYRQTVQTILRQQNINLVDIPYDKATGKIDQAALKQHGAEDVAALVIPQPNFFGVLDDVDTLTDWAREQNMLTIAVVNPVAMALLKAPGQWGKEGVDIVCGEGQPLGIPLASGGPYYGFLCTRKSHVRQMPGRLVGRTVDKDGKRGFVLTLQAREQHIRRGKATSNICTNQGLMVTASTIHMSLLGPEGLKQTALRSHQRTRELCEALTSIAGVERVFNAPFFHEVVVKLSKSAEEVLETLAKQGIQGGYALGVHDAGMKNCLLVCATETKTKEDIERFAKALAGVLEGRKESCQV